MKVEQGLTPHQGGLRVSPHDGGLHAVALQLHAARESGPVRDIVARALLQRSAVAAASPPDAVEHFQTVAGKDFCVLTMRLR